MNPNNSEYYHVKAQIEYSKKDYTNAIESANKSIELNKTIDGYYNLRARIKKDLKDINGAIEDAKQAVLLGDIIDNKRVLDEIQSLL
jgi:tetratricopeptide (TPR) repeat protein